MDEPPPKYHFKKHVKKAVIEFWEDALRQEALELQSIKHFDIFSCNLSQPHWIWATSGKNSFEVRKASILARMMSGRYRTDYFARHWTMNKNGHCLIPGCNQQIGNLQHLLIECSALTRARSKVIEMILNKSSVLFPLRMFFESLFKSDYELQFYFLFQPFSFHYVNYLCNLYGHAIIKSIAYYVRTFVFTIHAERQKLMSAKGEASLNTVIDLFYFAGMKPPSYVADWRPCALLEYPTCVQVLEIW